VQDDGAAILGGREPSHVRTGVERLATTGSEVHKDERAGSHSTAARRREGGVVRDVHKPTGALRLQVRHRQVGGIDHQPAAFAGLLARLQEQIGAIGREAHELLRDSCGRRNRRRKVKDGLHITAPHRQTRDVGALPVRQRQIDPLALRIQQAGDEVLVQTRDLSARTFRVRDGVDRSAFGSLLPKGHHTVERSAGKGKPAAKLIAPCDRPIAAHEGQLEADGHIVGLDGSTVQPGDGVDIQRVDGSSRDGWR
jgi:hypothetical protein